MELLIIVAFAGTKSDKTLTTIKRLTLIGVELSRDESLLDIFLITASYVW